MSGLRLALLAVLVAAGASLAGAEQPPAGRAERLHPMPTPQESQPPAAPGAKDELDCRNCHQSKHHGVLQMYTGLGGRGTPMIPSHMMQVRVQCVACHVVPKIGTAEAGIVGQTFRPSEQACLGCHGEKYRGMLQRWVDTLARMDGILDAKLPAAQAALAAAPKGAKAARARQLIDDAAFNARFVRLGKGVHNVFYAADLLKLANGWLDESMVVLGKPPVKSDDQLIRGGYCAVLCHEAAKVKAPLTVTFARQSLPHVRHVAEFGATCTSCHSAETHKAVTATPATCTSCHHGPQNDRCESCHAAQSAFYRGRTKTALATLSPNLMAETVGCTGCHDVSAKASREAIGQKCLGCHDAPYLALLREWTTGFDGDIRATAEAVERGQRAVSAARRAGRTVPAATVAGLKEAREALALVRRARSPHNPLAADALLAAARARAAAIEQELTPARR